MKPLVSVIIPVYKVEQYLQKCIESVCGQTLEALEIILVDDGSPDNCGRICDEYATRDSRIRVIHQRNGGLSAARNTGIRIAQADIIGFVDSDDWIEPDMIELLYRNLCKENADISVCGIYWHNKGNVSEKGDKTYAVQSSKEAIESVYRLPGVKMNVWNKLYRKHLFHEICFPEGRINEDVYVTVRLLDAAKKTVLDMQPKYHYMIRPGSITTAHYHPALFDGVEGALENYRFLQEKYPELAGIARQRWINAHFTVLIAMLKCREPVDREEEVIAFLKENRRAVWQDPAFDKKRKLLLLALCIHAPLCKWLIRCLKR